MLKIYGSMLCKDCEECVEAFDQAGIAYEFHDFGDSLAALKEFLALRDTNDLFQPVKEAGCIGIPCIVDEQGRISLDWEPFLPKR